MAPVLKRLAVNYPPILFHPINSITAYKGQIIYDTPQTEAKAETPVPYLQWQSAPGVSGPKPSAATDLSSLMVPPEQSTSHAGGPEAAPAPAPGPADPNAPAAPPPAGPLPAEGGG